MIIALPTLHARPSAQAVPLAAGCLAASLADNLPAQTCLIDLFPEESCEKMCEKILASRPRMVAFPLYAWNRRAILELTGALKEAAPDLFVVLGGPEASADTDRIMTSVPVDAVICGEGEAVFSQLVQALLAGALEEPLPGMVLRTPNGPLAGPQQPTVDLDALPSPWLRGLLRPTAEGGVLWEVSRGCPFACDYCYDGRGSKGVRHLSAERLIKELELLARSGATQVWVLDSTFNFPPPRGRELLRLLRQKAPHIHFHLEAKAEYLDEETAHLLGSLRCSVQIGLQSASPEVLQRIHRPFDARDFRRRVALLAAEGITYGFDLIYGLPGDDHAGFCASLEYALALRPNHLHIFQLAILPGTVLDRDRERLGLKAQSEPPYLIEEAPGYSRADLQRSRELANAVDLFYNRGRAVAFFPALLAASGHTAVTFFESFAGWLRSEKQLDLGVAGAAEGWSSSEILPLQRDFVATELRRAQRAELLSAARDLIDYHYHYAETLLGPETGPAEPEKIRGRDLWNSSWRLNPAACVVRFRYEVIDLNQMEETDLEQFVALFRPVGSTALFFRRGSEVFSESLEEDFARLLRDSDGARSPREIFSGAVGRAEGEELVEFAVSEGFLLPAV